MACDIRLHKRTPTEQQQQQQQQQGACLHEGRVWQ